VGNRGGWRPNSGRPRVDPTGKELVERAFMVTEAQDEAWTRMAKQMKVSRSELFRRVVDLFFEGHLSGMDLAELEEFRVDREESAS
jgi:hypothetical protein